MAQRVVFSFDDGSLESLKTVQRRADFSSMGTAVRESIHLQEVLQDQVADGFSEVILRNPITKQEKTLLIPSLLKIGKLSKTSEATSRSKRRAKSDGEDGPVLDQGVTG